jgi:hypothetical protein
MPNFIFQYFNIHDPMAIVMMEDDDDDDIVDM